MLPFLPGTGVFFVVWVISVGFPTYLCGKFHIRFYLEILKYTKYSCDFSISAEAKFPRKSFVLKPPSIPLWGSLFHNDLFRLFLLRSLVIHQVLLRSLIIDIRKNISRILHADISLAVLRCFLFIMMPHNYPHIIFILCVAYPFFLDHIRCLTT